MKMFKNVLLTTVFFCSIAYAADKGGNGGDVFICKDPSQNMILDYYEGLEKDMYTSFGDPDLTIEENYLLWIKNLMQVEPSRARSYKYLGLKMLKDIEALENGTPNKFGSVNLTHSILTDIPDSQELITPRDCVKHQLVIKTDQSRGEKEFKIQRNLWSQIDNVQKALMIAHEVVYSDFIYNGANDSRDARYFNQLVISNSFEGMSICEYHSFLKAELKDKFKIKYEPFTLDGSEECKDSTFTRPKEYLGGMFGPFMIRFESLKIDPETKIAFGKEMLIADRITAYQPFSLIALNEEEVFSAIKSQINIKNYRKPKFYFSQTPLTTALYEKQGEERWSFKNMEITVFDDEAQNVFAGFLGFRERYESFEIDLELVRKTQAAEVNFELKIKKEIKN